MTERLWHSKNNSASRLAPWVTFGKRVHRLFYLPVRRSKSWTSYVQYCSHLHGPAFLNTDRFNSLCLIHILHLNLLSRSVRHTVCIHNRVPVIAERSLEDDSVTFTSVKRCNFVNARLRSRRSDILSFSNCREGIAQMAFALIQEGENLTSAQRWVPTSPDCSFCMESEGLGMNFGMSTRWGLKKRMSSV